MMLSQTTLQLENDYLINKGVATKALEVHRGEIEAVVARHQEEEIRIIKLKLIVNVSTLLTCII